MQRKGFAETKTPISILMRCCAPAAEVVKEATEPKQLVFKDKKEALEAFKEFLRDKVGILCNNWRGMDNLS